jgi:hypothetical protein
LRLRAAKQDAPGSEGIGADQPPRRKIAIGSTIRNPTLCSGGKSETLNRRGSTSRAPVSLMYTIGKTARNSEMIQKFVSHLRYIAGMSFL